MIHSVRLVYVLSMIHVKNVMTDKCTPVFSFPQPNEHNDL